MSLIIAFLNTGENYEDGDGWGGGGVFERIDVDGRVAFLGKICLNYIPEAIKKRSA